MAVIKVLKPEKLQIKLIFNELHKAQRQEGKAQRKILSTTVTSWRGDKPSFKSIRKNTLNSMSVTTIPSGNSHGIRKWSLLDLGTSIRWALMSQNFSAKTKPGSFRTRFGSGKTVIRGRSAMKKRNIRPRSGIAARGWTKKIKKTRQPIYSKNMNIAMQRGSHKAYRGRRKVSTL